MAQHANKQLSDQHKCWPCAIGRWYSKNYWRDTCIFSLGKFFDAKIKKERRGFLAIFRDHTHKKKQLQAYSTLSLCVHIYLHYPWMCASCVHFLYRGKGLERWRNSGKYWSWQRRSALLQGPWPSDWLVNGNTTWNYICYVNLDGIWPPKRNEARRHCVQDCDFGGLLVVWRCWAGEVYVTWHWWVCDMHVMWRVIWHWWVDEVHVSCVVMACYYLFWCTCER